MGPEHYWWSGMWWGGMWMFPLIMLTVMLVVVYLLCRRGGWRLPPWWNERTETALETAIARVVQPEVLWQLDGVSIDTVNQHVRSRRYHSTASRRDGYVEL